ncbi:MAG: CehA/McbA family metallohydrolase [Halococcoides sp.]
MLSVELHAHSAASYDGRDDVSALLERASAIGLDALAVTDHDEFAASQDAVERAPAYDLVGIPGMEVTSAAGHVLALGIDEAVPPELPFRATVDRIHDAGGIAVVPHPFQKTRSGVMANISRSDLARADAIEVYNSRLLTGYANRRAESFAREHGLPAVAGSDAHVDRMVGQAITRVDAEPTSRTILDAIAAGETEIDGRRTPLHLSVRQAAGGAKRRVRNRLAGLLD